MHVSAGQIANTYLLKTTTWSDLSSDTMLVNQCLKPYRWIKLPKYFPAQEASMSHGVLKFQTLEQLLKKLQWLITEIWLVWDWYIDHSANFIGFCDLCGFKACPRHSTVLISKADHKYDWLWWPRRFPIERSAIFKRFHWLSTWLQFFKVLNYPGYIFHPRGDSLF